MKRLMISAMGSGSGKTTVTCGLMMALKNRGLQMRGFKCGPDYIDPMFHSRVLGVPSRNLDLFLQGRTKLLRTLHANAGDMALLEGAMGFYDGISGTTENSAWDIAEITDTPVVLVLRPKGQSITLAAQVLGMQRFREHSHIVGLLLTDCKPMLYAHLAPILTEETGLKVLGYLPPMAEAALESRHLGLLTAAEISDFSKRFSAIAAQMEQTVDLDRLLDLAETGEDCPPWNKQSKEPQCRIAVAWDEAFCFYYPDSLEALEDAGAELVYFSPMHDSVLPEPVHGLYLGGGYPELYAKDLSENRPMRQLIQRAVMDQIPMLAECGGFLYLQQTLQDTHGTPWPMVGALPGNGIRTARLQRFGYVNLSADRDSMLFRAGETIPAHEFHYWDCSENGSALLAQKPVAGRSWRCGFVNSAQYTAFPHLHLGGEAPLAQRFVEAARRFKEARI